MLSKPGSFLGINKTISNHRALGSHGDLLKQRGRRVQRRGVICSTGTRAVAERFLSVVIAHLHMEEVRCSPAQLSLTGCRTAANAQLKSAASPCAFYPPRNDDCPSDHDGGAGIQLALPPTAFNPPTRLQVLPSIDPHTKCFT